MVQILRTNYDMVENCSNCFLRWKCKHKTYDQSNDKRMYCTLYQEVLQ